MSRWAAFACALGIALGAWAQDASSIDASLASVENLKRRVQTEATEAGQRKAADAMLAARAELVRANANDPRVPVWLADQAEDCFTVALPAGGDVDRTLYGLAGPDARRRVRRLAVDMAAAAEQAELAAKAVLDRAGADAAPPPLVERLTTVERPRRIPLVRALADVLQVEMAEFDAGRRRALAESAIARIDTLLPELDDRTASVVARYAGLTAARIGEERAANRFLSLARQKAGEDEALTTLADLAALRAAGLLRGPASAAEAASVLRGSGTTARQLAIAELEARLRRQAEGETGGAPSSGLLAWTSPFTNLLRRTKSDQAGEVRDLAMARLAQVLRDGTPLPDGEPMAILGAAQHALDAGQPVEPLTDALARLAEDPQAPASLRAGALRTLARIDMAADRWAEAADRSLALARGFPLDPSSAPAMSLAVRIARELDRAADGADTAARQRLEHAVALGLAGYPEHADQALWQLERQVLAAEAAAESRACELKAMDPLLPAPADPVVEGLRARLASARAWTALQAGRPQESLEALASAAPPVPGRAADLRLAARVGALAELDRDVLADSEIAAAKADAVSAAAFAHAAGHVPAQRLPVELPKAAGAGAARARRLAAAVRASAAVAASDWSRIGDLLRLAGEPELAREAYAQALQLQPDALEPLQGMAEASVALGGESRWSEAMGIHRRLLAGREMGGDEAVQDRAWWLSQLRQLQILHAADRFDERARMRLNRLRAIDAGLGGADFRAAFDAIERAAPARNDGQVRSDGT
jgi:hypothetical protein